MKLLMTLHPQPYTISWLSQKHPYLTVVIRSSTIVVHFLFQLEDTHTHFEIRSIIAQCKTHGHASATSPSLKPQNSGNLTFFSSLQALRGFTAPCPKIGAPCASWFSLLVKAVDDYNCVRHPRDRDVDIPVAEHRWMCP
jgi:hypothetical protein